MKTKTWFTLAIILAAFSLVAQQKKVKIDLIPYYLTNAKSITLETTFSGRDMVLPTENRNLMSAAEKEKLRWSFAGSPLKDDVAKLKEKLNQQMAFLHTDKLLNGELDLLIKVEFSNLGQQTITSKQNKRVLTTSGYWETQEQWVTTTHYACTYHLSVLNKSDNKVLFTKVGLSESKKKSNIISNLLKHNDFIRLFPQQIKTETNSYKIFEQIGMMDSKAILKLIEKGQNVNHTHYDTEETLLMNCLNNKQAITVLLKNGAEINAQDAKKNTVLHHLAKKYPENIEMFEFLVKKGADLSIKNKIGFSGSYLLKKLKQNALDKRLLDAFAVNDYKLVENLVNQGANIDTSIPVSGKGINVKRGTLALQAYFTRNFAQLKVLARLGADLNEVFIMLYYTYELTKSSILMHAIKTNDIEMADSLMAYGASINLSKNSKAILDYAHQKKIAEKEALIQLFVKKSVFKNKDFCQSIIRDYLLAKGYEKDSLANYIAIAEKQKQEELLEYLRSLPGAERSAEEIFKEAIKKKSLPGIKSALSLCINKEERVKLINANFIEVVNKCKTEVVKFLIDEGAEPKGVYNACDLQKFELVRLLVNKGANINELGKYGGSTFHRLIFHFILYTKGKNKKPEIVKKYQETIHFMIEKGVDINDQNNSWKETPVMHSLGAFDDTKIFLLDILLKSKADLNKKNVSGLTAVMIATKSPTSGRNNLTTVKKLVEAGADYKTVKNKQGENAIEYAKRIRDEVPKYKKKEVGEIYKYLKGLN